MKSCLTYSLWKKDHWSILEELSNKKIIIPFSGGKDSSVVLSLIQKASEEIDINFEAHGAIFPTRVFSKKDIKSIDAYWKQKNVHIHWHESEVSEDCLTEAVDEGRSPCLTCIHTKKKVLMSYLQKAISDWQSVAIVMSYSLWDLVSAMLEYITQSTFHDEKYSKTFQDKNPERRFFETAQRFYPLLNIKTGPTIYKPLIKANDQDIRSYIQENKIPLTTIPCTYKDFRPKRILAAYYEKSELYFDYNKLFDFSKKVLGLPDKSYYEKIETKEFMTGVL